jgi:cytochrome o ubiquinol oxidase subunit II
MLFDAAGYAGEHRGSLVSQRMHIGGRLARALLVSAATGTLVSCGGGQLSPAGPVSEAERTLLFDSLVIMLAIVVPVIIATIGFAWWYRSSNRRARRRPDFVYSGRVELVTWSIPTLVIIFLGGIAWISSHDLDPAQPLQSKVQPLTVEVVSLDWKWLFIYPAQGVASVNRLVVPAGVPLHLLLSSATVWNVFWVPQLGSMIYCMHGMVTTLNLEASRPGVYYGESAMISGNGFATMHFDTDAVSSEAFSSWVNSSRAAAAALDEQSYRGLLEPTASVRPFAYRSVQPDFFRRIVLQSLPAEQEPSGGAPARASGELK